MKRKSCDSVHTIQVAYIDKKGSSSELRQLAKVYIGTLSSLLRVWHLVWT